MTAQTIATDPRITAAAAELKVIRAAAERLTSPEARAAVEYPCAGLEDTIAAYSRLQRGEMDPYAVLAPDMGWWDDPEAQALDYLADEASQFVIAARKRLAEKRQDEKKAQARAAAEALIAARRMAQL